MPVVAPARQLQCTRCRRYVTSPTQHGFKIRNARVDDIAGRWLLLRCTHSHPFNRGSCGGTLIVDLVAMQTLLSMPEDSLDSANDVRSVDAPEEPTVG